MVIRDFFPRTRTVSCVLLCINLEALPLPISLAHLSLACVSAPMALPCKRRLHQKSILPNLWTSDVRFRLAPDGMFQTGCILGCLLLCRHAGSWESTNCSMRSKGCLRGGSSRQAPYREPARYISRDDEATSPTMSVYNLGVSGEADEGRIYSLGRQLDKTGQGAAL